MKQARHSLALSLISLVLCITMLLGSTWAWFTDSVTSTNNRIATGKLDIELEYYNNGSWDKVTETTNIFREDTLWEPGHAEVVYFKISNLGSLALKYNFGVNVVSETLGINVSGDAFKLSDHIRYGVDLGKQPEYSGSQEAISAVSAGSTPLNLRYSTQSTMNEGAPEAYLALVVYMPETVGNVANAKVGTAAPKINLGITLAATQNTVEADSFGPDYDAGAFFPDNNVNVVLSAPVVTDTENKSVSDVTVGSDDSVSAFVPAGALIEPGADKLTLKVSELETTNSNITVSDGEESRSLDVHVDGIADGNTVPVVVSIKELMPKGLNMGNYTLYHVEDTTPVVMTYVTGTPVNHNEFSYDPVTGDVVVAMKSFSEVATIAEVNKAWEGNADFTWYIAEAKELVIANADQLWALSQIVGGMAADIEQDSFYGKTVTLACDINLDDVEEDGKIFYPIGYYNSEGTYEKSGTAITSGFYTFEGTFDGNGHKISNVYQNTWEMKGDHDWYAPEDQHYRDGMGLFGKVYGGTVKNLTVDNFSSDGEIATTGVIAAYADFGANFENIAITNCNPRVYNIGNGGIVGCVGWYTKGETDKKVTFKNITADSSNKISALWGSWDVACGGIVGQYYPTSGQTSAGSPKNPGIDFESCNISAQIDVFNDVCANYQYYAYRYAGMMIGSIRENETINGRVYPKMDGITAKDCKVHYETWNDYFYCELVANSLASYTHDHQFSRLERVQAVDGTTVTKMDGTVLDVSGTTGRYNFVVVNGEFATENATCYHFVDGKVWNHEDAGFEDFDLDGNGNLDDYKEDNAHIYLPFAQLFTGYGWGVTSKGLSDYEGIETMDITSTDQRESVEKFEAKFENNTLVIGDGCTVTIGNLFEALDGISINNSGVFVSVESAENGKTIVGKFEANADDWRNSTLTFNGTGLAKLTIQDYDYCTPTTLIVTVKEGPEAPTNASIVSGKLIDIDTKLTYEVARITLPQTELETEATIGEYSDYVPGALDSGLWSVRVKASGYTPASDAVTLWSRGANVGSFTFAIENDHWDNSPNPDIDNGAGKWYVVNTSTENMGETESYAIQTSTTPANAYLNITVDGTEREEFLTSMLTYVMAEDELVPVQGFKSLGLPYLGFPGTDAASAPATLEGKVVLHVYDNGTIKTYERTTGAWKVNASTLLSTSFANVIPADATGYIYRIDIDWVDESKYTLEDITIIEGDYTPVRTQWNNSTDVGCGMNADRTRYNYAYAKKLAPATTLSYSGALSGYEITGFDSTRTYRYSSNGVNFIDMASGIESFTVKNTGTYYFYSVEDSSYFASDMISIEVKELPDAPTELSIVAGNRVAGLQDGVDYEYAQVNVSTAIIPDSFTAGEYAPLTSETELTGGLWAVRFPATETEHASKCAILYVVGEDVGSVTWNVFQTNYIHVQTYPRQGLWTFINAIEVDDETYKSENFAEYSVETSVYSSGSGINATVGSNERHVYGTGTFTYVFNNEEIVPARDFDAWPSITGKAVNTQTLPSQNFTSPETITGKIVAHVYGGQQETYERTFTYPASGKNTQINLGLNAIIPDTETGYVWRVDIDIVDEDTVPYTSLEFNTESYSTTRFCFNGYAHDDRINYYTTKAQAPTPELTYEAVDGAYVISGLDSTLSYKISTDGVTYTDIPAGSTTVTVEALGTYYIYSVEDATYYQSKAATVEIVEASTEA